MTSLARKLARAAGLVLTCAAAIALPARAIALGSHPRPARHAQQIGYSAAAKQVIDRARIASGGAGWNLLRGWHESGRLGGQRYESWFDPLRYGMRVETRGPAGLSVHGYNGQGDWQILPSGETTGVDDRLAVAQTRTAAFLGASGFFYPGRFDARGEFLGVRQSGGRTFDVVNVVPWGGAARELWFDRGTHLLGRIVDRTAPHEAVTVELSDYRRVGPIRVAFRATIHGAGPEGVEQRDIDSVVFTPADRAMFSLPRTGDPAPAA